MGTQIVVPSPQHRYLEPYKNRVFQYDSKHSNLFLSRYTNQILNAVGDDSIVRGLEVTPEVNTSKTGINFKISPGALVQDLTYFEFQSETIVPMDDLSDFSEYYVVVYSNYRYIETVYENPLKFEATLYNPRTKRALSSWSTINNRIILGVYSFSIDEDHNITEITEEDSTIFFEEANVIRNGTFDEKTTDSWTPINAIISSADSGGALDSPYVIVQPAADEYQGLGQAFTTKPNLTYEVSFYVKSDESVPFEARILDKNALLTIPTALVVHSYEATSTKRWSLHTFRFTAFSNQTTLVLLKKSESLENKIYFDHICVFEYTPTRKRSELHQISMIDGGRIPTTEDLMPVVVPQTNAERWILKYNSSVSQYNIDCTQHGLISTRKGQYIMFYGRRFAASSEYHLDWKNDKISLYKKPATNGEEMALYFFRNPETSDYQWKIPLKEGLDLYSPLESEESFQDPASGQYLVFFNGGKLDESAYTVDVERNVVRFDLSVVDYSTSKEVDIYFISDNVDKKSWLFKTNAGVTAYYLNPSDEPFPSKEKKKYMVFLGSERVCDDDYLIKPDDGSITLDISPASDNIPLRIFYFANTEEIDETPEDQNFDEYKWNIVMKSGVMEYRFDKSRDPLKSRNNGYYLAFLGGKYLMSQNYVVDSAAGKITFSETKVVDNGFVELYFIKKSENVNNKWVFGSIPLNKRTFTPSESMESTSDYKSPDDGKYFVFLNEKELTKSQYNMVYAANAFNIDLSVPVPQGSRLEIIFITEPATCKFWNFETVDGVNSYPPKENEDNYAECGKGEYIFFMDGMKLSQDQYNINLLKNEVTFTSSLSHGTGNKCEIYFLGKE